jgi:predicted HTH transcriptional regulator
LPHSHYIKNLIAKGEGQQLDFKYEVGNSPKIAKTLVAFANTDGGTLLIGVKDNGNIVGVASEEEIFMIELACDRYCNPPIKVELQTFEVEGKTVLEVYVPASKAKPHYAKDEHGKWLVYVRREDENLLANNVLIEVYKRKTKDKSTLIRYELPEKTLLDYLNINEEITFTDFCKLATIPPYIAERVLVNLVSIGMVKVHITSKGNFFALKDKSVKTA